jgi:hypothetical protein
MPAHLFVWFVWFVVNLGPGLRREERCAAYRRPNSRSISASFNST